MNPVFALYKMPGTSELSLVEGELDVFSPEGSSGFVFCDFEGSLQYKIVGPCKVVSDLSFLDDLRLEEPPVTKDVYDLVLNKAIKAVENDQLIKVVISKQVFRKRERSIRELFELLSQRYDNAFVSLVSTGRELWMGATPERILEKNKEGARTVALAGTKWEDRPWTQKEFFEQGVVTEYIQDQLMGLDVSYRLGDVETISAGPLKHLRTNIFMDAGLEVLEALHPTPAVGGIPKKDAIAFIRENEGYRRRFYSGYLGPVIDPNNAHLFVNLRCMQLWRDSATVYVGGGIVKGSTFEGERKELEAKASVLGKFLSK